MISGAATEYQVDREGGFIAIHRRIESWPMYRSLRAEHRHVITSLLLMANWRPDSFWYGTTEIKVDRGQLAHSETTIAERAGTTRKVVRTTLEKLESAGFISGKRVHPSGQCPRVLTIHNYDRYQSLGPEAGPRKGQREARERPEKGQRGALREPVEPVEPVNQILEAALAPYVPTEADMEAVFALEPEGPTPKARRKDEATPRGECFAYWRDVIWPQTSDLPYRSKKLDFSRLTELLAEYTPEQVRKAMDGYPGSYFSGKIGLAAFCDKAAEFAPKAAGPPARDVKKVTIAPAPASAFGKGGTVEL